MDSFNNLSLTVKYYVLPHNLINFEGLFATYSKEGSPHQIVGWEDTYEVKKKKLTSRGILKATIQNAYWEKNSPADTTYRKLLKLKY